jgi:hypothetical protein
MSRKCRRHRHRPTNGTGLGMTAKYTHTRPETLRQQVEQALRG